MNQSSLGVKYRLPETVRIDDHGLAFAICVSDCPDQTISVCSTIARLKRKQIHHLSMHVSLFLFIGRRS